MQVSFTFRNLDSSDNIKNFAREKLEKLNKYLTSLDVEVIASVERHTHRVEIVATGEGKHFSGHGESEDMYASIGMALDKVERQIRDNKGIATTKMRHGASASELSVLLNVS